jgi:hypothetical protein
MNYDDVRELIEGREPVVGGAATSSTDPIGFIDILQNDDLSDDSDQVLKVSVNKGINLTSNDEDIRTFLERFKLGPKTKKGGGSDEDSQDGDLSEAGSRGDLSEAGSRGDLSEAGSRGDIEKISDSDLEEMLLTKQEGEPDLNEEIGGAGEEHEPDLNEERKQKKIEKKKLRSTKHSDDAKSNEADSEDNIEVADDDESSSDNEIDDEVTEIAEAEEPGDSENSENSETPQPAGEIVEDFEAAEEIEPSEEVAESERSENSENHKNHKKTKKEKKGGKEQFQSINETISKYFSK